jgi:hypothetical protein
MPRRSRQQSQRRLQSIVSLNFHWGELGIKWDHRWQIDSELRRVSRNGILFAQCATAWHGTSVVGFRLGLIPNATLCQETARSGLV